MALDSTLVISPNPANDRLYVGSRYGEIRSFVNSPSVNGSQLFLDLRDRVAAVWDGGFLGMVFHPDFGVPGSPYRDAFYVYYASNCPIDPADRTRVNLSACNKVPTDATSGFFGAYLRLSRFEVRNGSPAGNPIVDPTSEFVMLNIRLYNGGHRGGGMTFGNDGHLYLTIGDQSRRDSAQDVAATLDGGTLRFDVSILENGDGTWQCRAGSHKAPRTYPVPSLLNTGVAPDIGEHFTDEVSGQRYCIPGDNPWVGETSIFQEYYSLGHRSPHRLAVDPVTGRLWSGEVGASTREEINVIEAGNNYGWPYWEGTVRLRPEPAGFTYRGVLTAPVIDFVREEAKSIIGGYVYRGATYPELSGRFLAGDYVTGKIWAISLDESNMTATKQELASFAQVGALATWGQDNDGEVYLGDVAGSAEPLYELQKTGTPGTAPPTWLSQTFAFTNLDRLLPSDFFVPYALNEPFWSDGALKSRWIALPNDGRHNARNEQIEFSPSGDWVYPIGTVLMKHFELALDERYTYDRVRLETRFLVLDENRRWYGLTYRWLADQSDAYLLSTAETADFRITTEDGSARTQTWLFPGRDQCLSCHNPGAGGAAGPRTHQLNGSLTYPSTGIADNQLRTWNRLGMFRPALSEAAISGYPKSASKDDPNAPLELRARSYLDANCSYCHRPGTGNRASFDMRLTTPLADQGLINGGVIDDLGIANAHVVTPGSVATSVLYQRANAAAPDPKAMPPLAKSLTDTAGMAVLSAWIQGVQANASQAKTGEERARDGAPPDDLHDETKVASLLLSSPRGTANAETGLTPGNGSAEPGSRTLPMQSVAAIQPDIVSDVAVDGRNTGSGIDGGKTASSSGTLLQGTVFNPPATTDLSLEGTLDWVHWGHRSVPGANRKATSTATIGAYAVLDPAGSGSERFVAPGRVAFAWNEGAPMVSESGTRTGVFVRGAGNGFRLHVPAASVERTVSVYLGGFRSSGRFAARLSDGSASVVFDESHGLGNTDSAYDKVVTLRFSSPSINTTLEIEYELVTGQNITLQAATIR